MAVEFNNGYRFVNAYRVSLLITIGFDDFGISPGAAPYLFNGMFTRDTQLSF